MGPFIGSAAVGRACPDPHRWAGIGQLRGVRSRL